MNLQRIDTRPVPGRDAGCRAYLVCRNETARLPYVLDYHRQLGVARFFVVDNGSTDGSLDLLKRQTDCHVFSTRDSFAAAGFGVAWMNALMAEYGRDGWNLLIDADELFAFPHAEAIGLQGLCAHLDRTGSQGMLAFMLDMYGAGPIARTDYIPGTPFLDSCAWFDRHYTLRPRLPGLAWPFPGTEVLGGPRQRCFYPSFTGAGRLAYEIPKLLKRLRHPAVTRLGQMAGLRLDQPVPPLLTKVPLTKGAAAARYVHNHKTTQLRLAPETGVLLHFKYFSDFHHRVEDAVKTGEHFDGSSEYGMYRAALLDNPALSFFHDGSVRYRGTAQLRELGLIRSSAALDSVSRLPAEPPGAAPPLVAVSAEC